MTRWIALILLLTGCTTRGSVGVPAALKQSDATVSFNHGKVDLLFMIDNSPSMWPMASELRTHFGDLLSTIAGVGGTELDLHVGVVTSDYGAGRVPNGDCEASPGGQRGMLQALGADAAPGCQRPVGAPFLRYTVDAQGHVTSNVPAGQDVLQTFTCMASVGSRGCGFEHQLESVYAALEGDAVQSGFLREDAALTVVFVTNEDDGSAPPDSEIYEPLADPAKYGRYTTLRQTRFGIGCGDPLAPLPFAPATLAHCAPAPNAAPGDFGREYDVHRYIDLFTRPRFDGGIKLNPFDVALIAVAAPVTPVSLILAQSGSGLGVPPSPTLAPCAKESDTCFLTLQHSCQNRVQPVFFGDPAVRLQAVVEAAASHQLMSICGDDEAQAPSFAGLMKGIGGFMQRQVAGGCLYGPPVQNGASPRCAVSVDDGGGAQPLASCDTGASRCWSLESDASCPAERDPLSGASRPYRMVLHGVSADARVSASCRVYAER